MVSILGFPNAGKSTFMNNILKKKISIISSKVQTTRNAIKGILTNERDQLIFIDTPGLTLTKSYLNRKMSKSIYNSIIQSNINLLMYDTSTEITKIRKNLFLKLIDKKKKNFLVLNKVDKVNKYNLLKISKELNSIYNFDETFYISALKKTGFDDLLLHLRRNIPKGVWLYNNKETTDQKLEFTLSEITREKIFQLMNQEIPYSVTIESKIIKKSNIIKIFQTIFVNKKSQKPILLGKNGNKIKEIGIRARKDIEKKLSKKIYLDILISVDNKHQKNYENY
ncbi:MAG: GTPase Era [Rickettsiales bacterium]|nr:GTPase Era [Rickettsiales bacterium]